MIPRVRKAWEAAAPARGPLSRLGLLTAWAASSLNEKITDRRYRRLRLYTDSKGFVRGAAFGPGGLSYGYVVTNWRGLSQMFPVGSLGPDDVVLEYGSGKGRVAIWLASRFPVNRIIGIEINKDLHEAALANLEHWLGPRKCSTVEFVCGDATEFRVPDDVTTIYLYNFVRGALFEKLLDRLHDSLARRPRPLTVFYFHPVMHKVLLVNGFSLERSRRNRVWVTTADEYSDAKALPPYLPLLEWAVYRWSEGDQDPAGAGRRSDGPGFVRPATGPRKPLRS